MTCRPTEVDVGCDFRYVRCQDFSAKQWTSRSRGKHDRRRVSPASFSTCASGTESGGTSLEGRSVCEARMGVSFSLRIE